MALDSYTKLLMHMDNIPFIDECGHTITNNGVTLDTTNKKFGNGSAYFNGTNSYLSIPYSTNFDLSSTNYTIDFWLKKNQKSNTVRQYIFSNCSGYDTIVACTIAFATPSGEITDSLYFQIYNIGGACYSINTSAITDVNWHHYEVGLNGTTMYLFLDGVLCGTTTISGTISNTNNPYSIGRLGTYSANYYLNGNIDEFRISKGICRHITNFTPPTHAYNTCFYLINDNNQYKYFNKTTFLMNNIANNPPTANDYRNYGNEQLDYLCTNYNQEVLQMNNFATLGSGKYGYIDCNNKFLDVNNYNDSPDNYTKLLMHMDSTPFVDVCGHTITNNGVTLSTTTKKFGNGSAYFNGSSYYLSINLNLDLPINNTPRTIDCWIYINNFSGGTNNARMIFGYGTSSKDFGLGCGIDVATHKLKLFKYSDDTLGTTILNLNQWYHIAVVFNGTNTSVYLNGTLEINVSGILTTQSSNFYIGTWYENPTSYIFNGNIDEFRISNGIARWTSNFIPPNYKKYLIQDNTTNTIYTYNGTTLIQSASQTVDSSNFITNGFNDLTVITNTIWTNIFSDITHIRILYYTDDNQITENDLICDINSYRPIDDLQNQFTIDLFQDNG